MHPHSSGGVTVNTTNDWPPAEYRLPDSIEAIEAGRRDGPLPNQLSLFDQDQDDRQQRTRRILARTTKTTGRR